NDSGAIVGGVALFVLAAALAWLALDEMAASTTHAVAAGESEVAAVSEDADAVGSSTYGATATTEPTPTEPPARAGAERA
ncbi:MAG: hypothetical protein PV358_14755, partial [Acidimicrobiales bacterium]|nr:hypothetical protein [Acidimicrobiales bacterium]